MLACGDGRAAKGGQPPRPRAGGDEDGAPKPGGARRKDFRPPPHPPTPPLAPHLEVHRGGALVWARPADPPSNDAPHLECLGAVPAADARLHDRVRPRPDLGDVRGVARRQVGARRNAERRQDRRSAIHAGNLLRAVQAGGGAGGARGRAGGRSLRHAAAPPPPLARAAPFTRLGGRRCGPTRPAPRRPAAGWTASRLTDTTCGDVGRGGRG